MVVLQRFHDTTEAHMVRAFLEGSGIQCSLWDENIVTLEWMYSHAVGGVRLCVSPEDELRALELLEVYYGSGEVEEEEG